MAVATSLGLGRYAAAEQDAYLVKRLHKPSASATNPRGVIYFHGHGQTPADNLNPTYTGQYPLLRAIAEDRPVVACAAGGNSWGNATAVVRASDAKTWLQGATVGAKAGKVLLVGASMGGLVALNWAKANPTLVQAIVLIQGGIDLNDVHANNRGGFQGNINAAYGGGYDNATHGPTYNPAAYTTGSTFAGIPIQTWYSTDDPVWLPSIEATWTATVGGTVERNSLGALGHSEAAIAAVSTSAVRAFLTANAND